MLLKWFEEKGFHFIMKFSGTYQFSLHHIFSLSVVKPTRKSAVDWSWMASGFHLVRHPHKPTWWLDRGNSDADSDAGAEWRGAKGGKEAEDAEEQQECQRVESPLVCCCSWVSFSHSVSFSVSLELRPTNNFLPATTSCLRFVLASNSPVVAACCLSCFYSPRPVHVLDPLSPHRRLWLLAVSEVKHLRLLVAQNPGWLAGLPVVGCLAFPFGSPPTHHLTPQLPLQQLAATLPLAILTSGLAPP